MEPKNLFLKSFSLGTNLTEPQLLELANCMQQREAKKGQVVYEKNNEKKILLLVSGKVKISEINPNDDEIIKEIILPGDLFGDIMLSSSSSDYEFAEVVSDRVTYYCINQDQLFAMMKSNYTLTINYMAKLGDKFKSLESWYINMLTNDVRARLIYCLKTWAQKEGRQSGDKVIVRHSLTHSDLANIISTSRQTVTVILRELKESGNINYNRTEIELSSLMLAS